MKNILMSGAKNFALFFFLMSGAKFSAPLFLLATIFSINTNCSSNSTNTNFQENLFPINNPYNTLAEYNLFENNTIPINGKLTPKGEFFNYELNTPLFSDYAEKDRYILLTGNSKKIGYKDSGIFDMPIGTILVKNFSFPKNFDAPNKEVTLIETRLIINQPNGWFATTYVWDAKQTKAVIQKVKDTIPISFQITTPVKTAVAWKATPTDNNLNAIAWSTSNIKNLVKIDYPDNSTVWYTVNNISQTQTSNYLLPGQAECLQCHQVQDPTNKTKTFVPKLVPIGLEAGNLNKEVNGKNQLISMQDKGLLVNLSNNPPQFARFDDTNADLNSRARAYLESNCAYCHNPVGQAGVISALYLNIDQPCDINFGIDKIPNSAGTAGRITIPTERGSKEVLINKDIDLGNPAGSLLYNRINTTGQGVMPPIGRSIIHEEGADLIRDWIKSLNKENCKN